MTIPNELRAAATRAHKGEAVTITVRTLLGWFRMKRRGYNNVDRVRAALKEAELTTEPPFDQTWIDASVRLRATPRTTPPAVQGDEVARTWLDRVISDMRTETPGTEETVSPTTSVVVSSPTVDVIAIPKAPESVVEAPREASLGAQDLPPQTTGLDAAATARSVVDVEHRLGMLDAANLEDALVTVGADDSIQRVITIMSVRDFSQVPVMRSPGHCLGIVTWRSIGRFVSAHGRLPPRIADCLEPVQVYSSQRNLFEVVDEVSRVGCVLVRPSNSTRLTGIVTVSDLSQLFGDVLEPFVLVGEIETGLRRLLAQLPAGLVQSSTDTWTIGSVQRELERTEVWQRLELPLDHREFVASIEEIRQIRNDLMHFTPDATEPRDTERLRDFARFLRELLRDAPEA